MSETNDQRIYDRCLIRVGELEAENEKLREEVDYLKKGDILHVLTDQEYIDQCERERQMQVSIDALNKENDKLREEFDKMDVWHSKELLYAISENDKLRELCKMFAEYVSQDRCEGCTVKRGCNEGDIEECLQLADIRDAARELGVEVS